MRLNLEHLRNLMRSMGVGPEPPSNSERIDIVEQEFRNRREAIASIERDLGIFPPRKFE